MKRILLFVAIVSLGLALTPRTAQAHVLITDTSKTTGLVLHITPDDNPVAGQPSTLFFDIQDGLNGKDTAATLSITRDTEPATTIPLAKAHGSFTAAYTFPATGIYALTFTVSAGNKTRVFHYAQPVTQGETASPLDTPNRPLAGVLFAASCGLLLVTLIVAFNRKKEILAQSKF